MNSPLKIYIVLILITVGFSKISLAYQADLFNRGVIAFNAENYNEAVEAFESSIRDSLESYELYFNLGLAHFKLGHIGKSKLALERARLIEPNKPELIDALSILEDQIITPVTKIPDFILVQKFRELASSFSVNTWTVIQIIAVFLILVLLYFILFRHAEGVFIARIFPLILLILVAIASFSAHYKYENRVHSMNAIYMESKGFIYQGADERSEVVADISEGVKLIILDKIGNWYKVELEDKDVGWVPIKKVTII